MLHLIKDTYMEIINSLLLAFGIDPMTLLVIGFNAAMGVVSVPAVSWLKKQLAWFAAVPFLGAIIPKETFDKIAGWFTIIITGLVGLLFIYLGDWIFGWHVFQNPNIWNSLIVAFGVNQTAASAFFEWRKSVNAKKNQP
jgi:hypothetical protein